jgi:segregation and condensation protein A
MGYQVSTPVFEGPFDLLLHLVTRQQVDIWELSLSTIVDEFVATIEQMQALDLSVATEFLLTAAVLLELKARRLLPESSDGEDEEELALWEERDLLLARLLECKTFKDASAAMARLMDTSDLSVARRTGMEERFVGLAPDLLEGVDAEDLHLAIVKLLAAKPVVRVNTDHVAPVRASVADTLADLVAKLPTVGRTTFKALTSGLGERLDIIVHFLALLELYKRGAVDLEQTSRLGELHISWLGLDDLDDLGDLDDDHRGVAAGDANAGAGDRAPREAVLVIGGSAPDEYEG